MLTSLLRPALAGTLVLAAAAPSASAAEILSTRVSASDTTTGARCQDGPRSGDGVVTRRVRMPADGVVVARLAAARGDWDVAVFDARSSDRVGASSGFNSVEVAEGASRAAAAL